MIRRPIMAAALLTAALLPLAAMQPATAAKPKIKFSGAKLTPKTAKGGASATATIAVTATGGASVSSVSLRLVRGGSAVSSSSMTASGKKWTKSFSVPANTTSNVGTVDVWADAQTSLGLKSAKIGTLKVQPTPIDPNSPPPPPPI